MKPMEGLLGEVFIGKEKVPTLVEVLDCKYGNVIGYRPRKEVRQLLLEDVRFIGKVANKALAALENLGRSGSTLNVGITPSTGEVGVVIEVSKGGGLTAMECEKLTEGLKV